MKKASNGDKKDSGKEKKEFVVIIPNIRSAHNVGSLFRTADAAGVTKVYLVGYTPTLLDKFGRLGKPQKEIAKTALGAELEVPSEYIATLKTVVTKLKKDKFVIIGLEQNEKAIKLGSTSGKTTLEKLIKNSSKVALVVGEEVSGLTSADIKLMDYLIELPMRGKKESLNVSVASGIAMYTIAESL